MGIEFLLGCNVLRDWFMNDVVGPVNVNGLWSRMRVPEIRVHNSWPLQPNLLTENCKLFMWDNL